MPGLNTVLQCSQPVQSSDPHGCALGFFTRRPGGSQRPLDRAQTERDFPIIQWVSKRERPEPHPYYCSARQVLTAEPLLSQILSLTLSDVLENLLMYGEN